MLERSETYNARLLHEWLSEINKLVELSKKKDTTPKKTSGDKKNDKKSKK